MKGPIADLIAKYFQAAGADAERRIRLFRLAWDFVGSDLGGRGELYERFYLSDSCRMTGARLQRSPTRRAPSSSSSSSCMTDAVRDRSIRPGRGQAARFRGTRCRARRRDGRASCRRRRGTTSATSSSSSTGPTRTPSRQCCRPASSPTRKTPAAPRRSSSTGSRAPTRASELRRPGAQPVQGVLPRRQRAARRRAGDDVPVHLGRPRLRARARLDPGLPEEARLGLDDAHASGSTASPTRACAPARVFGGTLAANDRRLAQGAVTLERVSESGPTHNDPPLVNVRHFPRLAAGQPRRARRPRARPRAQPRPLDLRDLGGLGDARALRRRRTRSTTALAPVRMGKGFRFTFAYTVDDLATVREL